jgi:putative MATE family efflux protein
MKKQIDLLNDNVNSLFLKYLFPSISATLVTSIYVLADTIMIGKGISTTAIAALNILLPLFSLFFGTGMLFGVGGAVLMSVSKGENNPKKANQYFTVAFIAATCITVLYFLIFFLFFERIISILGSTGETIGFVREYGLWLRLGIPFFVFSSFLQAFIRNDKAPKLSMIGVIAGGVTNVVLDYIFIFILHMGMAGAAIATVIGSVVTTLILLTHFFTNQNTMKLVRPQIPFQFLRSIAGNGLSSFIIEISGGIVIFVFNIQLLRYIGDIGVSVYSIISNSVIIVMSLMNGISQAAQPIIATNYGSGNRKRVISVRRIGMLFALGTGCMICLIGEVVPHVIIDIFIYPDAAILELAPAAIRIYFISFIGLGINIFFSNYFQAVLKPFNALLICLLRGLIFSILFVYLFPVFMGVLGIWLVMPVGEVLTFFTVIILLSKENGEIKKIDSQINGLGI